MSGRPRHKRGLLLAWALANPDGCAQVIWATGPTGHCKNTWLSFQSAPTPRDPLGTFAHLPVHVNVNVTRLFRFVSLLCHTRSNTMLHDHPAHRRSPARTHCAVGTSARPDAASLQDDFDRLFGHLFTHAPAYASYWPPGGVRAAGVAQLHRGQRLFGPVPLRPTARHGFCAGGSDA